MSAAPTGASGPERHRGAGRLVHRRAARVIVLDPDDRVLMVRGHDQDQPSRCWWFLVGGGLDAGESTREAAVREVREETGIVLGDGTLVGPVFTRSAAFDFVAEHWLQDEDLFVARVGAGVTLSRSGWTAQEDDLLDEVRWFSLAELAAVELEVFPVDLVALVRSLLDGWDGVTRHLDETTAGATAPVPPVRATSQSEGSGGTL